MKISWIGHRSKNYKKMKIGELDFIIIGELKHLFIRSYQYENEQLNHRENIYKMCDKELLSKLHKECLQVNNKSIQSKMTKRSEQTLYTGRYING